MEAYIKSYDVMVWRVIKLGDIPIPTTKSDDKESGSKEKTTEIEGAIDLSKLANKTHAQLEVIQVNS